MRLVPLRAAVLGTLFAAVFTLPGLGNGTLWDNSETVYGEAAREVLLAHDWVVLHVNGQPWFVQPPLFFWIAAICAKIFGVGPFALRLPAALSTIAMGGALGYATARVAGPRAGTLAAIVLSTSLMQAIVGRLAIMDALLDLCVTIAILCWYRAFQPHEQPGDGRRRAIVFVAGAIALAFGTLAKGPVAPVIVVLVIGAWLLWERRSAAPLAFPNAATLLLAAVLFVAIVAPWFVLEELRVGPLAFGELIGHYTIGRYTGVIENQTGPWWYYVPVLILGFFPWIAFTPVALVYAAGAARLGEGSFARLALTWTVVPLLFFSAAQTKLPNYVALLLPALAIVVALWFEHVSQTAKRRAAIVSALTIPLFVGALGIASAIFIRNNRLEAVLAVIVPQLEILGALMLAGSLLTIGAIATRYIRVAPYVLGVTSGVLVLFIAFVAEPLAETFKPIPVLARTIDARREPGSVVAAHDVAGTYALIFYTRPGVLTIDDPNAEFAAAVCKIGSLYVVTRVRDVPGLAQTARREGRRATVLQELDGTAILHVEGPPCGHT